MIAVLGQCVEDVVFDPDGRCEVRLGGPPLFASEALARERRDAIICTRGGSEELRAPLHRFGLDVVAGPAGRTFISEMMLLADGQRLEAIAGLGDGFSIGDIRTWLDQALSECRTVVCGAVWRDDFPPDFLRHIASQGKRVLLDGQGWARPGRLGPLALAGPLDPSAVSGVDVLKLSEEEADVLIGGIDATAPERVGVPSIVVTLGERGAVLLSDGSVTEIGVEPVYGLADTVGAGDAFLALMAAELDRGAHELEAAATACANVSQLLRDRLRVASLSR